MMLHSVSFWCFLFLSFIQLFFSVEVLKYDFHVFNIYPYFVLTAVFIVWITYNIKFHKWIKSVLYPQLVDPLSTTKKTLTDTINRTTTILWDPTVIIIYLLLLCNLNMLIFANIYFFCICLYICLYEYYAYGWVVFILFYMFFVFYLWFSQFLFLYILLFHAFLSLL